MVFGVASSEPTSVVADYKDYVGASFPFLLDTDGSLLRDYSQQQAFWSAAYPQDWVIGADFKVAYVNNGYEPDEMIAVVEEQLASGR